MGTGLGIQTAASCVRPNDSQSGLQRSELRQVFQPSSSSPLSSSSSFCSLFSQNEASRTAAKTLRWLKYAYPVFVIFSEHIAVFFFTTLHVFGGIKLRRLRLVRRLSTHKTQAFPMQFHLKTYRIVLVWAARTSFM